MTIHYRLYKWKEGIPYGINPVDDLTGVSFKIPMDPYRKRICIERYLNGIFEAIVYDSALINFRHLTPENQLAWQKTVIDERSALIRDQDDRVIFIEKYQYTGNFCRFCEFYSPHGIFLAKQKVFYECLGDSFNGVILYDTNGILVLEKRYDIDPESKLFTELLEEKR